MPTTTVKSLVDDSVSVQIVLCSDGGLAIQFDASRLIPIEAVTAGQTLIRVLEARLAAQGRLGQDGAPTRQQVRHWEQHAKQPNGRCPFCRAEQFEAVAGALQAGEVLGDLAWPQVKKIASGLVGASGQQRSRKSSEELGL